MAKLVVSRTLNAPPSVVWADLRNISSHVDWMADAASIRFLGPTTEGVGTRFECDTHVGPFHLTDVMEITKWIPEQCMGVRHRGLVRGSGEFRLAAKRGGRTRFTWQERLRFRWFLGGRVTAWFAKPVLRSVWKGNLRRLAGRF